MKTIYKFLFACVSGVINLVYHVHSARAEDVTAGIEDLGPEFYYVCTPCNANNMGACSFLYASTADGADINSGATCRFYGVIADDSCTGSPKTTICNPGSYWNPVSGACVTTGCPDSGYLATDKMAGYWQEATTCERRHYYGGVVCSTGPDGDSLGAWHDCKLYFRGGIDHSTTGYTDNIILGGEYSGATIEDCQKSQFTTSRGSGIYDPLCNYTI